VEDSVYVAPGFEGRGFGKAALMAVIDGCQELGLRQMIAAIGDSSNAASIGVHRACGFERVGLYSSVGFKFDRWVDVVLMQRRLAPGQD
jgi:phosphinothricin acetyltransferase